MNPIVQFSGQYIDLREMRNISEVSQQDGFTFGFTIYFKGVEAPFNLNYARGEVDAVEFQARVEMFRNTLANTWAQYWGQYDDSPLAVPPSAAEDYERLVREDDEAIATLMGSDDD